eukprot:11802133-Alexandrium_andersonii.AAC.1
MCIRDRASSTKWPARAGPWSARTSTASGRSWAPASSRSTSSPSPPRWAPATLPSPASSGTSGARS